MKIWFKGQRWWAEKPSGQRRKFKTEMEAKEFLGIDPWAPTSPVDKQITESDTWKSAEET